MLALQSREQAEEWLKVQGSPVPFTHPSTSFLPLFPRPALSGVGLSLEEQAWLRGVSTFHGARALCGNEPWISQETDLQCRDYVPSSYLNPLTCLLCVYPTCNVHLQE